MSAWPHGIAHSVTGVWVCGKAVSFLLGRQEVENKRGTGRNQGNIDFPSLQSPHLIPASSNEPLKELILSVGQICIVLTPSHFLIQSSSQAKLAITGVSMQCPYSKTGDRDRQNPWRFMGQQA